MTLLILFLYRFNVQKIKNIVYRKKLLYLFLCMYSGNIQIHIYEMTFSF